MTYLPDEYELRARLFPGFIVLLPLIIVLVGVWPDVIQKNWLSSSVFGYGCIYLLGRIGRDKGAQKEIILFERSNGIMPATEMLRHRDNRIDTITKQRYHHKLSERIPNAVLPTEADEQCDPNKADQVYESAVRWLREYSRDRKKYPLVAEENTHYGFCRNLWALKPWGMFFTVCAVIFNLWAYIFNPIWYPSQNIVIISATELVILTIWVFFITQSMALRIATAYGRALLAVCEEL